MDMPDNEGNLCRMLSAEIEGLLEVNREFSATQTVQIQPLAGNGHLQAIAYYSSTVTPMERAVPATMDMAASMLAAFRSGILVVAI